MSLKLSPGCQCCDEPPPPPTCPDTCSTGTFQDEYDVTLSGLTDTSDCAVCENLNGVFTLGNPIAVTSFSDGWSGNSLLFGGFARASDVPAGATHACVWRSFVPSFPSVFCSWDVYVDGLCIAGTQFYVFGLTLAKFRISDTSFIWRMIVNYRLALYCSCYGDYDSDEVSGGWYWQLDETTDDCSLSGSETWTAYTPVVDLNVFCFMVSENLTFADYCGGTLAMTNIEDG